MIKTPWKDRKFATGITSMLPGGDGLHYPLFDVDDRKQILGLLPWLAENCIQFIAWYSPRGIHAIDISNPMTFQDVVEFLKRCPYVDKQWLKIGEERGHLFLAEDEAPLFIQKVSYMALWRKDEQKETDNSRLGRQGVQSLSS